MKYERVRAALEGYKKQLYPDNLDKLNETYDKTGATGYSIKKIGKSTGSHKRVRCPFTEDMYMWFWGLFFENEKNKIAVLFPWAHKNGGNYEIDRSISVYADSRIKNKEADELIRKICQEMM